MVERRDGQDVIERIEQDSLSRRTFVAGAVAAAAAGALLSPGTAQAAAPKNLTAVPPAGFVPFTAPGRIVQVTKQDCLMPNKLYPKADDAKAMLERAMKEQIDRAIKADVLKPNEGMRLLESYEQGLKASTYLQF